MNYNANISDLLRSYPVSKKRVFISFVYDDDKNYFNLLHAWSTNNEFDIEFFSESVRIPFNSTNAEYIKSQIREKIKRASITLCLASIDTYKSSWVNWEIEESIKQGNSLVAVKTWGNVQYIPQSFKDQNYIWVDEFKHEKIKNALDRS